MELTRPRKPTTRMMAQQSPGPGAYYLSFTYVQKHNPKYTMTCTRRVQQYTTKDEKSPDAGSYRLKSQFDKYDSFKYTAVDRTVNKPVSTFGYDRFPEHSHLKYYYVSPSVNDIYPYELSYKAIKQKGGISMSSSRTINTRADKKDEEQPFGYNVRDKTSRNCMNRSIRYTITPKLEYYGEVMLDE